MTTATESSQNDAHGRDPDWWPGVTNEFVFDMTLDDVLLDLVLAGDVLMRIGPNGEHLFKLTEQGMTNALSIVRGIVHWAGQIVPFPDADPG